MEITKKPGENTKKDGGFYQEESPNGDSLERYKIVRDDETLPPTSKEGNYWRLIEKRPDNKE